MFDSHADNPPSKPTFAQSTAVWARIGFLSFGGPAGQIALMHKELVEERRWIGERRFLHALNYCMLLPGPEAQQLAIYIGWLMHRTIGGLVAGILFVLPGAIVMLTLSVLYAQYRHLALVDAAFLGIKAAVLAIVFDAVVRIGRRTLKNRQLAAIAAASFVGIYVLHIPFPIIIVAAGLCGWLGGRLAPEKFVAGGHASGGMPGVKGVIDLMFERGELQHAEPSATKALRTLAVWLPLWLGPVAVLWLATGPSSVWTQIGSFFSLMAVVTFGGAYAVLAYVAQAAVETYGWLAPGEMIDGLGLAETTPGPLILVLEFVGYLAAHRASGSLDPVVAGILGAMLTIWVTFVPCFLWIFLGGPYVEALRNNRVISSALAAITAALVGVILNLALWFSLHVLFGELVTIGIGGIGAQLPVPSSLDWRAALLAAGAALSFFWFRTGLMPTLLGAAIGGGVLSIF